MRYIFLSTIKTISHFRTNDNTVFKKGGGFLYSKFANLLQKNKVTAYRVAKETNIPTSTLSDWKTGRSKPKIDKLQRIANYFGIPVNYFLEEDKRNG